MGGDRHKIDGDGLLLSLFFFRVTITITHHQPVVKKMEEKSDWLVVDDHLAKRMLLINNRL